MRDSDIAYVLGVLWGDGSLCIYPTKTYKIYLGVNDRDFAEEFKKIIQRLTGCSVPVKRYNRRYVIQFNSKKWALFFKKCSVNSIRHVEEKQAFIRGFFDSEGCVGTRQLGMSNTSKKKILALKMILESLGYHPGLYSQMPSSTSKGKKRCYTLSITKASEMVRFREEIGCSIKRKKMKLDRLARKRTDFHFWTKEENEYLKNNYLNKTDGQVAQELGLKRYQVQNHRYKCLNLKKEEGLNALSMENLHRI